MGFRRVGGRLDAAQGRIDGVEALVDEITGTERLIKTTQTTQTTGATPATKPAVKAPAATGGVVSGEVPE